MSDIQSPADTAQTHPKSEPGKFELRSPPRQAVRLRRGIIIGISAGGAILIAGISWLALGPTGLKLPRPEMHQGLRRVPAGALDGVPENYGDVPLLGPPLPGDLGRPILKRRNANAAQGQTGGPEQERLPEPGQLQAASSSTLMVTIPARPAVDAPRPVPHDSGPEQTEPLDSATLAPGTIIAASLITGLNSDLPGTVLAQVTEPVWDSATGTRLLVPQGSRLVGEYDNRVAYGQRRAMLSWSQLVLPDGRSIGLAKLPAADLAGFSGLEDSVDFHGWRLLKGIALSTALGLASELGTDGEGELREALGGAALHSADRAGDEITRRNLDVKPTITVRPGWPVRIILNSQMSLPVWRG